MDPTTVVSTTPLPNLVLSCISCKTILGDSQKFVCASTVAGCKMISIRAATDVTVDRIPQKATHGGQNYTFFHVCCSGCGSVVGRMYTEAPADAQPLINCFSFEVEKCASYRLGSADIRVSGAGGEGAVPGQAPSTDAGAAVAAAEVAAGGNSGPVLELLARVEALEAELLKMQGMILVHDSQLQGLPGYFSGGNGPEG